MSTLGATTRCERCQHIAGQHYEFIVPDGGRPGGCVDCTTPANTLNYPPAAGPCHGFLVRETRVWAYRIPRTAPEGEAP